VPKKWLLFIFTLDWTTVTGVKLSPYEVPRPGMVNSGPGGTAWRKCVF
jgi:hypothetical protein